MFYSMMEKHLKTDGYVTVHFRDNCIKFDLTKPHERRYALSYICNIQYPQFDIDRFIIDRFVEKGDSILDAGGNIGLTALLFLEAGAEHVTSIEALPELADRINQIGNKKIRCINCALSDMVGNVDFYISELHNQGSTYNLQIVELYNWIYAKKPEKISIPTLRIDDLEDAFDIWKIDVEGAEIDVIRGAGNTLLTKPPRIIYSEVIGGLYMPIYDLVKRTHPYVYRAVITKKDYCLAIISPEDFASNSRDFHSVAPTFLFSKEKIEYSAIKNTNP